MAGDAVLTLVRQRTPPTNQTIVRAMSDEPEPAGLPSLLPLNDPERAARDDRAAPLSRPDVRRPATSPGASRRRWMSVTVECVERFQRVADGPTTGRDEGLQWDLDALARTDVGTDASSPSLVGPLARAELPIAATSRLADHRHDRVISECGAWAEVA